MNRKIVIVLGGIIILIIILAVIFGRDEVDNNENINTLPENMENIRESDYENIKTVIESHGMRVEILEDANSRELSNTGKVYSVDGKNIEIYLLNSEETIKFLDKSVNNTVTIDGEEALLFDNILIKTKENREIEENMIDIFKSGISLQNSNIQQIQSGEE